MGPCKLWHKCKTGSGYGCYYPKNQKGKQWLVHRWVYTCAYGPIPKGMVVCHKCDTPLCYKLDHLFLGTQKDNIQDMISKGRDRERFSIDRPQYKLKDTDVINIKLELQSKNRDPYWRIAERYGVKYGTVADIAIGRTWGHVKV